MSYTIEIETVVSLPPATLEALETAVTATLRHAQTALPAALTLLITDDAQIRQLNRDFRDEDKPTDVLSFPAGAALPGMDEALPYLGDIAISAPYAQRQAQAAGHPLTAELQLLAVHGVLHLLGYDHGAPEEKAEMWAMQTAVLSALGLQDIQPTET